jgi:hypothetical protein
MKHAFIALAFVASTAHAQFWSGNDLLNRLDGRNTSEYLQAQGYILGATDAGQGSNHCIPGTVNGGQVFDLVHRFLRETPELRHQYSADLFVTTILKRVWPCQKREMY